MSVISKTRALVSAAAFLAIAGTAAAQENFTASFDYSPTAPVSQTYAAFQDTATQLCKIDRRDVASLGVRTRMQAACTKQLVADAVAATRMTALIAYHREQNHISAPAIQLAARD